MVVLQLQAVDCVVVAAFVANRGRGIEIDRSEGIR